MGGQGTLKARYDSWGIGVGAATSRATPRKTRAGAMTPSARGWRGKTIRPQRGRSSFTVGSAPWRRLVLTVNRKSDAREAGAPPASAHPVDAFAGRKAFTLENNDWRLPPQPLHGAGGKTWAECHCAFLMNKKWRTKKIEEGVWKEWMDAGHPYRGFLLAAAT